MIRNLKALGLALVAVFAMSAVVSSVASAEVTSPGLFTANVGANVQATIDGEQEGINLFTVNGLALTCGTVTLTGHPVKTKAEVPPTHESVLEGNTKGPSSTDVTLLPKFGPNNCHVVVAGLTKTVTVTENGCGFVFDAKKTVTAGVTSYAAVATVECPVGKKIEVHVYSTAAGEGTTTCTYDIEAIAANTTMPGITLTNKVNQPTSVNDVTADISVKTTVNNTIKSAVCGQNATEIATYEGNATLRATNEASVFVDASVS